MNSKKKTLYEILAVAPGAAPHEIEASYQSLIKMLESQKSHFSADDFTFRLKVLNLAYGTLSNPTLRGGYDAELAVAMPAAPQVAASSGGLMLQPMADTLTLRAEAMALRAEAMSLRADALSIKSDAVPYRTNRQDAEPALSGLMPILKRLMMIFGGLAAVWMLVQVSMLMVANRRGDVDAGTAARARDKVVIQEYYQTHGVRPGSKIEADLLEAENRKKEVALFNADREKKKVEDDQRRFEEDARRRAAEVSDELRFSENQAKEQARRDEEEAKWKQEQEKRYKEEVERNRLERERDRWQQTLRR